MSTTITTSYVAMSGIYKTFGAVQALKNVKLTLNPGEIHTIAGENGSGKSTLLKILGGVIQPDQGQIAIDGQEQVFPDVRSAMKFGVTVVSQELSLVPHLSAAENVFLGHNQSRNKFGISWSDTNKNCSTLLKRLDLDLDPSVQVGSLSHNRQQLIEIARALSFDTRVLLLDEPTSALDPNEVESLFRVMRQLRDEGVAVVFISHRMREMLDISDRYTVLREGQFIDTAPASEVDSNWLLDRMVLQRASKHTAVKSAATTKPIVRLDDLKDKFGSVNGVSLEFFPGQITGMAGLAGAGRTELVETIVGFRARHSGQVFVNDQWVAPTPKAMMHAGVALVPDDRRAKSNFLEMSVRENLTIAMHNLALAKRSKSNESKVVKEWVEKLRIRTQDIDTPIKNLSGGNQQKVIIARCLQINPKFLILDEPTRGIDLGAKAEIYEILRNLANDGLSILAVSSELVEIFEISQRVLVMHAGVITADLTREEATEQRVVAAATGEGNG